MNQRRLRIIDLCLCLVLVLSAVVTASAPQALAAPEQIVAAPQWASTCRYGSLVWGDSYSYGYRIWRHYLRFDWCFDGRSATVLRKDQWFEIHYPNTQVTWKTLNDYPGADGSRIIEGRGELRFCLFGYLCLNKYSAIKLQLLKDGRVIKLSG